MKANTQLAKRCFVVAIIFGTIGGILLLVAPELEVLYFFPLGIAFLSVFYALAALFGQNWLGNRQTTYKCPHCHKEIKFSDFKADDVFPCEHCGKPIRFSGEF